MKQYLLIALLMSGVQNWCMEQDVPLNELKQEEQAPAEIVKSSIALTSGQKSLLYKLARGAGCGVRSVCSLAIVTGLMGSMFAQESSHLITFDARASYNQTAFYGHFPQDTSTCEYTVESRGGTQFVIEECIERYESKYNGVNSAYTVLGSVFGVILPVGFQMIVHEAI